MERTINVERTVRLTVGDLALHLSPNGVYFGSAWKDTVEGVFLNHKQFPSVVQMFNQAELLQDEVIPKHPTGVTMEVNQNVDRAGSQAE